MTIHPIVFRITSVLAALALIVSSFGLAMTVAVDQARAATMAEQIICYVDQQLGPNIPFDPQIDYCGDGTPDPEPLPQCFDTIDNDNDGVTDLADPDCDSALDDTESGSMGTSTGTTTPPMQCADGIDNDNDGVTDLNDPDCDSAQDNTESGTMGTSTGTTTPMQCADTLDNDNDGLIDLNDPGCANAQDNDEYNATSTGTTTDAMLHVDSIDAVKTTAVANDTYPDGWRYVFHITTPNNEENLSMRFSDWFVSSSSSSTIPVANNMRIMSSQASSTEWVTLTGSGIYSTPALVMMTDLNPAMPGRQVQVVVEVKIPVGTTNETFSTYYGVQTLP
jgi:hypothetical protein